MFDTLFEACLPLLSPSAASEPFVFGMIGGVARATTAPLLFTDLESLLVPGLASLNIIAEIQTLPDNDSDLTRILCERLRYGVQVPVFKVLEENKEEIEGNNQESNEVEQDNHGGLLLLPITNTGIVTDVTESEQIEWRDEDGKERLESQEAFRAVYSSLLRMRRKSSPRLRRKQGIRAALLRWLAYSDAFPNRIPTTGAANAPIRAASAAFLYAITGTSGGGPVATRLRRSARLFDASPSPSTLEEARLVLREAVLLDLQLPAVVQKALLTPPDLPLSDIARRELIYMARAGTRDVKTLAARRLASERHHPDARSTLDQLAHDSHAWVRAAAQTQS